jgi:hypothetical protein
MQEEAPNAPDLFGLPEFFITDVRTEIDGTNVRIMCGVKRGGKVHWLYSSVMPADKLLLGARQCASAAQEAFNLVQMMDRRMRMGQRGH